MGKYGVKLEKRQFSIEVEIMRQRIHNQNVTHGMFNYQKDIKGNILEKVRSTRKA